MVSALLYLIIFSVLLTFIYFLMMLGWLLSWKLYFQKPPIKNAEFVTSVTVILPVRNEESNIAEILKHLIAQNYPKDLLEIIVSDDFSSDGTTSIFKEIIEQNSSHQKIKLIKASEDFGSGKKAAIEHAINHSHGELIITTDADCRMNPGWVKSFVEIFERNNPSMITGFVKISSSGSLFTGMQSLEFLSLAASSAMTVIRRKPLMCNGANLAFTKTAFIDNGGYSYGGKNPSGDDTFLMLKIAQKNPASILFNNSPESIVSTIPEHNLRSLISQRIRWASKVRNYKEGYIKRTGFFIFILNVFLVLLTLIAFEGLISWKIAGLIWFIKWVADLFVIYPACTFASQRNLLLLFLPAAVIYPFYSIAGIIFTLGKTGYIWKGRMYGVKNNLNAK